MSNPGMQLDDQSLQENIAPDESLASMTKCIDPALLWLSQPPFGGSGMCVEQQM